MGAGSVLADRLVATGFIRPAVLWAGLKLNRPAPSRWSVSLLIGLSGLLIEPLAWLQTVLWSQRLKRVQLPQDPIVVIGHWRSGTTYLHQLLACDPHAGHGAQFLTTAPQVALLSNPGFVGYSERG